MSWGGYQLCVDVDRPYVVLDLETTGLSPHENRVIEIGAFRVVPGATNAPHFQRLIRSPKKLSPRIVKLTGITDAMLEADGVDPCDAMSDLIAFIGGDSIVAYNASFDLGFINASCERHAVKVSARGGHSCALRLARRAWPEMENHKLGTVWDTLGIVPASPVPPMYLTSHRALGDAYRTSLIYQAASRIHLEEARTRKPARARTRATVVRPVAPAPIAPAAAPQTWAAAATAAVELFSLVKKLIGAWTAGKR